MVFEQQDVKVPEVGFADIAIDLLEVRFWIASGLPTNLALRLSQRLYKNSVRSRVCDATVSHAPKRSQ